MKFLVGARVEIDWQYEMDKHESKILRLII